MLVTSLLLAGVLVFGPPFSPEFEIFYEILSIIVWVKLPGIMLFFYFLAESILITLSLLLTCKNKKKVLVLSVTCWEE